MLHVFNRLAVWTLPFFFFCFCPFYWKPGSTHTHSAMLVSIVGNLYSHGRDWFSLALKRKGEVQADFPSGDLKDRLGKVPDL